MEIQSLLLATFGLLIVIRRAKSQGCSNPSGNNEVQYSFSCPANKLLVPGIGLMYKDESGKSHSYEFPDELFDILGKKNGSIYETEIDTEKYGCTGSNMAGCLDRVFSCVEETNVHRLCPPYKEEDTNSDSCGYWMSCGDVGENTYPNGCFLTIESDVIYSYIYKGFKPSFKYTTYPEFNDKWEDWPKKERKSFDKRVKFKTSNLPTDRFLIKYEAKKEMAPSLNNWDPTKCADVSNSKIQAIQRCPGDSAAEGQKGTQAVNSPPPTASGFSSNGSHYGEKHRDTVSSAHTTPRAIAICVAVLCVLLLLMIAVATIVFVKKRYFKRSSSLPRIKITARTSTLRTSDISYPCNENIYVASDHQFGRAGVSPPASPNNAIYDDAMSIRPPQDRPRCPPPPAPHGLNDTSYSEAAPVRMPDLILMNLPDTQDEGAAVGEPVMYEGPEQSEGEHSRKAETTDSAGVCPTYSKVGPKGSKKAADVSDLGRDADSAKMCDPSLADQRDGDYEAVIEGNQTGCGNQGNSIYIVENDTYADVLISSEVEV